MCSFLGSSPRGTMSCRIQGIFCPSIRLSPPVPPGQGPQAGIGPRGYGPQAKAPRPVPQGQGLQGGLGPPGPLIMQATRPRPPGQSCQVSRYHKTPKKWTDGQTDGQNIPCILQDIVPLGPLPCSQLENLEREKNREAWQGYC